MGQLYINNLDIGKSFSKLILLDVANGNAVCRMSQISQCYLSPKTLILQLIAQDPVDFLPRKY